MQFNPENKHLINVSFNTVDAHPALQMFQPWDNIPRLSIITGKNGSGKSKLLAHISQRKQRISTCK
jgi:predicted ATPase